MQSYQAMQATAQTTWQSGSDSPSNTSTGETTWKFVWQTLTNTNSSNSKSSNLRQSSGNLSVGNPFQGFVGSEPDNGLWKEIDGIPRRGFASPNILQGFQHWCVCVSSMKLLILNLNNKHLKSTFCEGYKAVFLVSLWLVDLHGKVPRVIKR